MAARTISSMYLLYKKNAAKVKMAYFHNKHDEISSHINEKIASSSIFFTNIHLFKRCIFNVVVNIHSTSRCNGARALL